MELPEWIPQEEWEAYLEMRKKIKKPATEYALKLCIKKLEGFKKQGYNVQEILENSIMNSWQGLFEPKIAKKPAQQDVPFDPVQRTKDLIQSYETSERIAGGYEEFRARMKQSNILKH